MTPPHCAGANSRPASPFRTGVAVPEPVVSAAVTVGRLWLSLGSLGGFTPCPHSPLSCRSPLCSRCFRGALRRTQRLRLKKRLLSQTWHGNPTSEYSKPIQDDYMQLWRKRARLPDAWLPFPFGVIHILSAEQALEYGVVDEVIDR